MLISGYPGILKPVSHRTMLIYLEEYPKTHLTTVVMEMNSIYSWVKVEVFNEFLDIGVQSLTISNKGELDLVSNEDIIMQLGEGRE